MITEPTTDINKSEVQRRNRVTQEYLSSPEYQAKLLERAKVNDAGQRSEEARQHIAYLCARPDNPVEGCIFFIENFGWTMNPKQDPKHFPFILFDFQKRAIADTIKAIDEGSDLFIEKSREMGVSWLVFVYVPLWYWLFRESTNILLGSYKEKLVDDRTIDSLFGKLDYAIVSLPKWLLPSGFNMKKNRTKLKLVSPNGNIITGDTMNPQFGRGSRKTAILFDELGFWDYAQDAWESAGDSTNCRIANSTPNGYNYYAMLRETSINKLRLHWSEHPLKDQQWYEYEKSRRTEEEVAQELDISYSRSKVGRVYPEWMDEINVQTGFYPYDPDKPLFVSWDFGKTDDTAIIWLQPAYQGWQIIDTYRNTGKNIDFYVPLINGIILGDNKYDYTEEEQKIIDEHRNWKQATHFGDPAGRFTSQVSDESVIDVLRRYGIRVNFQDAWKQFNVRKSATKRLIMDRIKINDNKRTKYFHSCISQAAYPEVRVEGVGQVRSDKPKHDWTSHYRSSLEYMALGLESIKQRTNYVHDKFPKKEKSSKQRVWGRRNVGY